MDEHALQVSFVRRLWDEAMLGDVFTEPQPFLAHYSSIDVALNILRTGELWARDMSTFAATHYEDEGIASAVRAIRQRHSWYSGVMPMLLQNHSTKPAAFSSSTSLDDDSEHLWRGYGNGGRGAAVILDTRRANRDAHFMVGVCIYSEQQQIDRLTAILDGCDKITTEIPENHRRALLMSVIPWIFNTTRLFKRPEFRTEQELRLFCFEYRSETSDTFPQRGDGTFRALPLRDQYFSPFAAIRLGPLTSTEDRRRVANALEAIDPKPVILESELQTSFSPVESSAADE